MKYKSLKIIVLAVFVLLTAVLIKPTNVSAGCYAQNPTWTPSSVPWSKVAIPVTFDFSQISYNVFDDPSFNTTDTITGSCTTTAVNGAKCNVAGLNKIAYPTYMPCPSNRGAFWSSPFNHIDTVPPTCGTWSGSGPTYTLSGSTDTGNTGGDSGINVAGGNCTATSGNSCIVNISDVAGNTKVCTSPVYGSFTVNATAGTGGSVTPESRSGIAAGNTTTFTASANSGYIIDTSLDGVVCSGNPCGSWTSPSVYTTGPINANGTYTFSFTLSDIVNGQCSSPQTHYTCAAGTSTGTTGDTSTAYNWSCNGSGGGANVTCTESKTPSMSGTLSASSCFITAGNNSCSSSLSWSTTNPEGISNVTSNTPAPNTVVGGPANSGTSSASVSYGTRTFFLNNNSKSLVPTSPSGSGVIATATCASGTTWNGSVCASMGGMTGTLTPASSTCTITSGASTCTKTLTWTTTNPVATSAVTNADGATPNPSASNNNTSQVFTIHYINNGTSSDPSTFYLYNNEVNLATATVIPVCTAATAWDGTKCAPSTSMTGTLTSMASSCIIASGASSCNIPFSWTTTNPVATSAVTKPVNVTVAAGNSGTNVPFAVKYDTETFHLLNNGVELAVKTVTSICTLGTGWNGIKCVVAGTCQDPAANNFGGTIPCTYDTSCSNGAINYSACDQCSIGYSLVNGTCVANGPGPMDAIAGACATTHYVCTTGPSINNKSNPSKWTWTCSGSGGGADASCSEKKSPGFIEN
jgi:hypothetical protein